MDTNRIARLLKDGPQPFPAKHVDAALGHFGNAVDDFRGGKWEECTGRAGKFVEATTKAIAEVAKVPVVLGRAFKVDTIFTALKQTPAGSVDDTIRLTIPRCCTFIYDIASNRGGRHDPQEVSPNEMDATAAVSNLSWILAEMVRFAQRGAVNLEEAREQVEALVVRKYPAIEKVEGRFYLHKEGKSAFEVAVVALADRYPGRMSREELMGTVRRNGFGGSNARMAISRLAGLVDDDGKGGLRLLATGRRRADKIMGEGERGR